MVWIKAGFPSNKQHFTRRVRATCTDATVRFVLLELSLAAAFDSFWDLITLTRRVYSHQHHSHFHESASTPVSILCHACLKPRRGFVTVYKPYFKWLFNGLQFFTHTQFIVCLTFIIITLILVIDYQEKLCNESSSRSFNYSLRLWSINSVFIYLGRLLESTDVEPVFGADTIIV